MVSQTYRCDHHRVATDRLKRIAAAIRKRREELRLTQEMIAYESGTSVRNYARIEAGTVNVRVLSLYQIATVLKTTPSRLLDAADEPSRRKS
jgi:transcriptional regulator with XRE-family HTH domain